jgi:hypothetical protein
MRQQILRSTVWKKVAYRVAEKGGKKTKQKKYHSPVAQNSKGLCACMT